MKTELQIRQMEMRLRMLNEKRKDSARARRIKLSIKRENAQRKKALLSV
jgi:hypothetical protein